VIDFVRHRNELKIGKKIDEASVPVLMAGDAYAPPKFSELDV